MHRLASLPTSDNSSRQQPQSSAPHFARNLRQMPKPLHLSCDAALDGQLLPCLGKQRLLTPSFSSAAPRPAFAK